MKKEIFQIAKPILFNTDMVQAILEVRKTATRRLVMPHNRIKAKEQGYCQGTGLWVDTGTDNGDREGHIKDYSVSPCWISYSGYIKRYAPYKPGDTLYVRETWSFIPCTECAKDECYGAVPQSYEDRDTVSEGCYIYRAGYGEPGRITWRPSIHMPKAAARIWLRVTDVRAERLQEIDGKGCIAEGVEPEALKEAGEEFAKGMFHDIWDSVIKKPDIAIYGWDANPWVWVIGFERCRKPEPCILRGTEPASVKRPCTGYQKSEEDDEPCGMCKGCMVYDGYEPESEG